VTALRRGTGSGATSPRLIRISRTRLAAVLETVPKVTNKAQREEMAIPAYLHWNPLVRWLMWRRYGEILRLGEFKRDHAVLEFGCGAGVFLPTLTSCARSVVACDLFPQYAQRMVQVLGLDVEVVEALGALGSRRFDRIVAADVLEHVPNPLQQLDRFAEFLEPDGRLLVSGPTESLVYKLGRVAAGFAGKGAYHKRDIDDIRRLAEESGYRVLAAAGLPFRVAPRLFWVYAFRI